MTHSSNTWPSLDAQRMNRAAGVLLGAAVGDALGVPYEFQPSMGDEQTPQMIGGGPFAFAPGEYSDDTQMQLCVAEVAASGADLRSAEALDRIAANFLGWYGGNPKDVGNQTRHILGAAARAKGSPGEAMLAVSRRHAAANPDSSAGNGSLMRTGVVALAHLDDVHAMAEAAAAVSSLTHADQDCVDACVLWCSGIRTAVLDGGFGGVRAGLALLPAERRALWAARLDEAEAHEPRHFGPKSGWVVAALQAAWSAITRTPVPAHDPGKGSFPAQHFRLALEAAVRTGHDTDTVAAIAGALLGARWGCSGIPLAWQGKVHGWPGRTGADLVAMAALTACRGADASNGWPSARRLDATGQTPFAIEHPHDAGVLLGSLATTQEPGGVDVDAVVSLCRTGSGPVLDGKQAEHVRVWLVDQNGANANLHFVVDQAAREVLRLRQEGKRVLLHCHAGQSRTPAVAAVYGHLATGLDGETALKDLRNALTGGWHLDAHQELRQAVLDLTTGPGTPSGAGSLNTGRFVMKPGDIVWLDETPDDAPSEEPAKASGPAEERLSADGGTREAARSRRANLRASSYWGSAQQLSRARGLLLGLALGDAIGAAAGELPAEGPLQAGVSSQLACFTTEGAIRGLALGRATSDWRVAETVWHAYSRWAAQQGIEPELLGQPWTTRDDARGAWPDGWLADVPALAERRGSAPATVKALTGLRPGTPQQPVSDSRGAHALTRTLPMAVAATGYSLRHGLEWGRSVAALTHGDTAALSATGDAVLLLDHCLTAASAYGVLEVLDIGIDSLPAYDPDLTPEAHERLRQAVRAGVKQGPDAEFLRKIAARATAPAALRGGLYVVGCFPDRAEIQAALTFAAKNAPDGRSVACVAGALLGAIHGVEALPAGPVSRLELSWVLDSLARDLVTELTAPPGERGEDGWDPQWAARYPMR
ncbi:ADP-ribosylglycohydrolase family protein [Streptomyces sp. MJP52]|uniref:ADP-ribosylglycohydrolase family protein n=1 Tax=Streptomyces sp. MJP52 TaxID=2940555 RepID=UPI00247556E5|nr:ADP-ribosylglycohydrolase family protein [Streptomyces sp. MJP52]MDH6228156.1 ADP-ribosylglycohydrolase [Streptomyces sp. MJP52]